MDVALQFALNGHAFGVHICFHLPIRTNSQIVTAQLDRALDLSVDVEIFAARQFSLDDDRLADVGKFAGLRCVHEIGPPNLGLMRFHWRNDYISAIWRTQSAKWP